jgi:hypothetical protein
MLHGRLLLAAVASLTVAALVGCAASGPTLRTDYDRTVDFSKYQTYGFVEPSGTDKAGYSSLITSHFRTAVDAEMQRLGYRYEQKSPDLLVNFNANTRENVDVRSTPSVSMGVGYYGYRGGLYGSFPVSRNDVSTVRYKVGTANIDVVDAAKQQLVWEGVAEGKLTKESMANPQAAIRNVVGQLFAEFPGAAGRAAD